MTTARALRGPFDYRLPPELRGGKVKVGSMLVVPFGRREVLGVVVGLAAPHARRRRIGDRLGHLVSAQGLGHLRARSSHSGLGGLGRRADLGDLHSRVRLDSGVLGVRTHRYVNALGAG